MKVKIKGLVFVGFAAAILSANAMAEGEQNIVTSLAYTDATYQKQADKLTGGSGSTIGANSSDTTKFTTAAAVVEYVGAQAGASDFTGADASNAGTRGLVPAPAAGDQGKFLKGDGTWANETTYNDVTAATSSAAGTHGLVPAPASDNYNTTQFLKNNGQWTTPDSTPTDNSDNLITSDAVYEAVNTLTTGKQPLVSQNQNDEHKVYVGLGGATWDELKSTTYVKVENAVDPNDATKRVTSVSLDGNSMLTDDTTGNFANVGGTGATAADNSKIPTAAAVKAYVDAQSGSAASGILENSALSANVSDKAPTVGLMYSEQALDEKVANKLSGGTSGNTSIAGNANATDKYPSAKAVADYVGNGTLTVSVNGTANATTFTANQSGNSTIALTNIEVTTDKVTGAANDGIANVAQANEQTKYPSVKAVKDYVEAQPAYSIPAKDPEVCTATYPCALVAEGNLLNWRVMAVSSSQTGTHAAGYCGNLGDADCDGAQDS